MERKTQQGYLVLADISGYTFFLAKTELEHAHLAISYLLEEIVEKLCCGLTLSKLEGDAVFAYVEEGNIPDGKSILDVIDKTYEGFRDKAETLYKNSPCDCNACKAIPTLDLKFMVHHGDYIIQQVAGIKDLLGTDVNLIHRLLKNGVTDSTGWRGYALFTDQGLNRMQMDKSLFIKQSEVYEHLGKVDTYIVDMHVRYGEMKSSFN